MAQSSDPLIKLQFSSAQGARRTLASEFKSQLTDLMRSLRVTESHYIRCVKSNSQKKPRAFEGASCLEQLRCAGVFEAVTIRKNGYPFRYTFQRFVERYKCIMATESGWVPLKSRDKRQQCHEIITTTKQPFANMKWGSSMLFFRADECCSPLTPSRTQVSPDESHQVPRARTVPGAVHRQSELEDTGDGARTSDPQVCHVLLS
jgi:myosin heavy subunit